ncbi:hypothetical protein AB0D49_32450 [Streptomyces sp. NPDC048290]|uniref:hypothetical protein n=1 Tax=Streptomyces sp. NPDC048290 TaxID=3155811 RepID=UPI00342A82BB
MALPTLSAPAVRVLVLAAAFGTTLLMVASGCAYQETAPPRPYLTEKPAAKASPSPKPSEGGRRPDDGGVRALSDAQAQAALITEADLGEPWMPTEGAATWRDGFLKAAPREPECRRLMDALYADDLLGAPARATVGLDDGYADGQLRYQVTSGAPADLDRSLAWLRSLPQICAKFVAGGAGGARHTVTVEDVPLPETGDTRQGLRVTVTRDLDDGPVTLTLDVAAVRVGDDALTVTNGGLGEILTDTTTAAVELGAERLAEVRRQGRVQV